MFPTMTENTFKLASYVQTVNGFCADLAGTPETAPLSMYYLRLRIEAHGETHGDPDRALVALAVACRYGTMGDDEPNGRPPTSGSYDDSPK